VPKIEHSFREGLLWRVGSCEGTSIKSIAAKTIGARAVDRKMEDLINRLYSSLSDLSHLPKLDSFSCISTSAMPSIHSLVAIPVLIFILFFRNCHPVHVGETQRRSSQHYKAKFTAASF
jgi:hypothetical protein